MSTETGQIITTALAVLGAVLGVFNAWRNWIQDRVRLKVRESFGMGNLGDPVVLIEMVNLSNFPITVTHVGFDLVGTDRHAQVPRPTFLSGDTLPVRLESRTAATVVQPMTSFPADGWLSVRHAYVLTACGLKRTSNGRWFKKNRAAGAAGHP